MHVYDRPTTISQSQADQCYKDPGTCPIAALQLSLLVASERSSCDQSYINASFTSRDPQVGVQVYLWNSVLDSFLPSHFVNTTCRPRQARPFSIGCQQTEPERPVALACSNYLAVVESCDDSNEGDAFHIAFYKETPNSFEPCQPLLGVNTSDNQNQSICRQEADAFRTQASRLDQQTYDLPRLLPFDSGFGRHHAGE